MDRARALRRAGIGLLLALVLAAGGGCAPSPGANVLGYLLAQALGTDNLPPAPGPTGALEGTVLTADGPLAGATVLVAEPTGRPHTAITDAAGRYRIEAIPPGQYVPAAVAPGYEEMAAADALGIPRLLRIAPGQTTAAPDLALTPYLAPLLPDPLAQAVELRQTAAYTAAGSFPPGAAARVYAFEFHHAGVKVDTLRLYLPLDLLPQPLPLLFMIYPTHTDGWEPLSVGFAAAGFALVALSPMPARAVDIDAHAQDARIALHLAQAGALGPTIRPGPAVALGGSFSSPILHRLLRSERARIAGWVTVGGVSNAFTGAAAFYAGAIHLPDRYRYAIPALGAPNIYPLLLLRYSPVFTAATLPPTLIIHTAADEVTPLDQAHQLEAALRTAQVPVEVFYYEDVTHYLEIGEKLTPAGKQMHRLVVDFAHRLLGP